MFPDASGSLGMEHARDLQRAAAEYRAAHAARRSSHPVRGFFRRGQLGAVNNYRVR